MKSRRDYIGYGIEFLNEEGGETFKDYDHGESPAYGYLIEPNVRSYYDLEWPHFWWAYIIEVVDDT